MQKDKKRQDISRSSKDCNRPVPHSGGTDQGLPDDRADLQQAAGLSTTPVAAPAQTITASEYINVGRPGPSLMTKLNTWQGISRGRKIVEPEQTSSRRTKPPKRRSISQPEHGSKVQPGSLQGAESEGSPPSTDLVYGLLAPGVTRVTATHFIVRPGLGNSELQIWLKQLPKDHDIDIMMAYIEYERLRILAKMKSVEDQYDRLVFADYSFTDEWHEKLQAVSQAAVAACLHKGAWRDNYSWLIDTGNHDGTDWAYLDEELITGMTTMCAALDRLMLLTRSFDKSGEQGDGSSEAAHLRLQELRGKVRDSGVRRDPEVVQRHLDRAHRRTLSLELGMHLLKIMPSPLQQERGSSPESIGARSAGGGSAHEQEQYSFASASKVDAVDMSLVVQRLAALERNQADP